MAFKPIDPKRDEYRRYLEHNGVIESLTKVLINILKERPENPIDYLVQNIGYSRLQADNVAYLESELSAANLEIKRLRDIIHNINPDLLNDVTKSEAYEEVQNVNDDCIEIEDVKPEIPQEPIISVETSTLDQHQTNIETCADVNKDSAAQ